MRLRCSFCGLDQHQVKTLFKGLSSKEEGTSVYICDECVKTCNDRLKREEITVEDGGTTGATPPPANEETALELLEDLPTPQELYDTLDKYVISQNASKRTLAVAVYNHYKRILSNVEKDDVEIQKSNIMLIGPTGSGKTLLAQTLARTLKVPFAIADATTLTQAGYVGEDVENILLRLLQSADGDVEKAQRGIIYLDEVDKITRTTSNVSITRDVSGEGVQQALLKILEGTVANVPPTGGRKHPHQDYIRLDTSNILFISGGAFSGLVDIIRQRTEQRTMGFGADVKSRRDIADGDFLRKVQPQDLLKYGLIPEFYGRFPILTTLDGLGMEEMKKILTEPRNALVKQYQKLFEMDDVSLVFEDEAIEEISRQAIDMETGARGLRAILERSMLDIMFDLPSFAGEIAECHITADVIRREGEPRLVRHKEKQSA